MPLDINQVRKHLESPRNRRIINRAIEHEERLKFHVETSLTKEDASRACQNFLKYVKDILPNDKYRIFLSIFRFPVMTNEVSEQIFNSLEKIFDGRDPYWEYSFNSDSAREDWEKYKEQIGGNDYWKFVAFEVMKVSINSFQIVDMSRDQEGNRPDPYHYFKSMSQCHDFGYDHNGVVTDLMWFKEVGSGDEKKKYLYVIDDESYRVFPVDEGNQIPEEAEVNNPHILEYCPARFFWNTRMKYDEPAQKRSELTNQLSNFDNLLFTFYSKMHLDLYCAYPIYFGAEVDCDYKNPATGDKCENGFIKDRHNTYKLNEYGAIEECPVCAKKRQAGPGTFVEIPWLDEDDDGKMPTPIGMLQVDKGSLEYNRDELARKKKELIENVVGFSGEMPDQAVNRFQVGAMMESMKATLLRVQKNFELAQKWAEETICFLRYGKVIFEGAAISYGTEHYLFSLEQLIDLYKQAKEGGAHESELDSIQDQIMETEHRNNPNALSRAKILVHLEPFRHMTRKEVLDAIKGTGSMFKEEDVRLKLNFSNLVTQFEREFISVVEFGTELEFSEKINRIYQKLIEYVTREDNGSGDSKGDPGQQGEGSSSEAEDSSEEDGGGSGNES